MAGVPYRVVGTKGLSGEGSGTETDRVEGLSTENRDPVDSPDRVK